ncbi:MAG: energy-coupling factor ABC transporter substrate-binding protein [Clostridiales bacterium]|nr:energy-coupling factor ABC transporter substrate-binding protein [Clostridiales bacterium]
MKNRGMLAIILILLCTIIAIIPLTYIKDSEFGGADDEAEELIAEVAPDYKPWAENIFEPPGGETESLLFCLQAALGAGLIGLGFGYLIGRNKFQKQA